LLAFLIILAAAFLRTVSPCQEPLTYRIGKVDERFGLTRQEFAIAVSCSDSIDEPKKAGSTTKVFFVDAITGIQKKRLRR